MSGARNGRKRKEKRTHPARILTISCTTKHHRVNDRGKSREALDQLEPSCFLTLHFHFPLVRWQRPPRQSHDLTVSEPTREVD